MQAVWMFFLQMETSSDGRQKITKLYNPKLKINEERTLKIRSVLGKFEIDNIGKNNGVCKNCYSCVERVIRMEKELERLKCDINATRRAVLAKS
ncbi:hypothetical protein ACJMK2_032218 [Sinanodonta woodiana]|uniref:Uncharacterized protein n=1 Tax=Sinanodonta woodiana TaxID=1069815 RepID=A0ABD3X1M9_SINWO